MPATPYTDNLGNAWLIDNDEPGVWRAKLATPAYETPIMQIVVAAPSADEVKQGIEEYAGEYDRTNAKPRPRIFATATGKPDARKSNTGAIVLVLLALFAIAKGKR